ncbi:hypothetical protein MHYP_G00162180 [Metynnis hypsauchen]
MKRGRKHRKTKQSTALEMKQERELSPPPSPPACGCWSNCFPKMPLFGNKGRKQERQREKEQLQELQTERRKTELTLTKTTQKTKKERQRKIQKEEALGVQESSSVMVELIAFDSAASKLIGSTTIKLQEVLYKSSVTQHIDLRLGRTKVCKLDADLMFTYGSFGYGYSHQVDVQIRYRLY